MLTSHFELGDNVYAQARIGHVDSVSLWLGANVMLEYPLDEVDSLLREKYGTTLSNISDLATDIAFCREQITTTEVCNACDGGSGYPNVDHRARSGLLEYMVPGG